MHEGNRYFLSPDMNFHPFNLQGFIYQIVNRTSVHRLFAKVDYNGSRLLICRQPKTTPLLSINFASISAVYPLAKVLEDELKRGLEGSENQGGFKFFIDVEQSETESGRKIKLEDSKSKNIVKKQYYCGKKDERDIWVKELKRLAKLERKKYKVDNNQQEQDMGGSNQIKQNHGSFISLENP